MTLEEGLNLGLNALVKTMDTVAPAPKKIEILLISKNNNQEVTGKFLNLTEVEDLLKKNKLVEQDKE